MIMKDTTTTKTIDVLCNNIIWDTCMNSYIVIDNGSQFISDDFAMFVRMNMQD